MYYETYRNRGHKRRERHSFGCMGFLLRGLMKLLIFILLLALLAGGLLYAIPVSFFNTEPQNVSLSLTDGLPSGRINILLLGLDIENEGLQRSDSMLVASIGYGSVRLVSIMRDTEVEIPGHGRQKINSAYTYGGAELAMQVVNETFSLNITRYAAVDFVTLVKLIDAIGGIDLEITDAELEQMNINVGKAHSVFQSLGYTAEPMTQSGNVHLNGLFALGYARIRKIDSDYARASRQRKVISAMLTKMRKSIWNPAMLRQLFALAADSVSTNLKPVELISIGEKALLCSGITTSRVPQDEYASDNGSSIAISDQSACVQALHAFLYE